MPDPAMTIALQTDKPLAAYGPLAQAIENYGFDGVSVYNDLLFQPAWLPLLEIARATRRVRLGPAAISPFLCHPLTLAGQIALLDEAAPGRVYLGLARGAWLDDLGLLPQHPVPALRAAFACVRHLLRRVSDPFEDAYFPLAGGTTLRWPVADSELPFLLGSWGPQTIRACIALVNEVKIGGSANPALAHHMRQLIANAAREAGRAADAVGLVLGAVTVVDHDGAAARAEARRQVALYLPVVARLDPTLACDPELLTRIAASAGAADATRLIADDLLARFAFAGTPDDVAAQAGAVLAAGASRVEFGTPHGLTTATGLELLGTQVLPALRSHTQ
jgi:5,10-methylenetetrahydromethanopterin reductase